MEKAKTVLITILVIILLGVTFYGVWVQKYFSKSEVADEFTEIEKIIEEYEVVEGLCGKRNVSRKCQGGLCHEKFGFTCREYKDIKEFKLKEDRELKNWNRRLEDCSIAYPGGGNWRAYEDCLYKE